MLPGKSWAPVKQRSAPSVVSGVFITQTGLPERGRLGGRNLIRFHARRSHWFFLLSAEADGAQSRKRAEQGFGPRLVDFFCGGVAVEGGIVKPDLCHAAQDVGQERPASRSPALGDVGDCDERNIFRVDSCFEQRFAAFVAGFEG